MTFLDPNGAVRTSLTFTATGLKIVPTATATGETVTFDGNPHPGSGTCSNGLDPVLTYSNGSAPVASGSYTLTVTCGAGSTVYETATATATISIGMFTPIVTVTCPPSVRIQQRGPDVRVHRRRNGCR